MDQHEQAQMRARIVSGLLLTTALLTSNGAAAGRLPVAFLDSVVALGAHEPDPSNPNSATKPWFTAGSGFLYQVATADPTGARKSSFVTLLVTAGHVVKEWYASSPPGSLFMRVNSRNGSPSREIPESEVASASLDTGWVFNPHGQDIAVHSVNLPALQALNTDVSAFNNDGIAANTLQMQADGAAVTDPVAVIGFPMNMAGASKNYVIARTGTIARLGDVLDKSAETFLIDCFVFPGNSGGPVVLLPDVNAVVNTKVVDHAYLIGVLLAYVPYRDVAASLQTHEARITFEENSGLAEVAPMDLVDETVRFALSKVGMQMAPAASP